MLGNLPKVTQKSVVELGKRTHISSFPVLCFKDTAFTPQKHSDCLKMYSTLGSTTSWKNMGHSHYSIREWRRLKAQGLGAEDHEEPEGCFLALPSCLHLQSQNIMGVVQFIRWSS